MAAPSVLPPSRHTTSSAVLDHLLQVSVPCVPPTCQFPAACHLSRTRILLSRASSFRRLEHTRRHISAKRMALVLREVFPAEETLASIARMDCVRRLSSSGHLLFSGYANGLLECRDLYGSASDSRYWALCPASAPGHVENLGWLQFLCLDSDSRSSAGQEHSPLSHCSVYIVRRYSTSLLHTRLADELGFPVDLIHDRPRDGLVCFDAAEVQQGGVSSFIVLGFESGTVQILLDFLPMEECAVGTVDGIAPSAPVLAVSVDVSCCSPASANKPLRFVAVSHDGFLYGYSIRPEQQLWEPVFRLVCERATWAVVSFYGPVLCYETDEDTLFVYRARASSEDFHLEDFIRLDSDDCIPVEGLQSHTELRDVIPHSSARAAAAIAEVLMPLCTAATSTMQQPAVLVVQQVPDQCQLPIPAPTDFELDPLPGLSETLVERLTDGGHAGGVATEGLEDQESVPRPSPFCRPAPREMEPAIRSFSGHEDRRLDESTQESQPLGCLDAPHGQPIKSADEAGEEIEPRLASPQPSRLHPPPRPGAGPDKDAIPAISHRTEPVVAFTGDPARLLSALASDRSSSLMVADGLKSSNALSRAAGQRVEQARLQLQQTRAATVPGQSFEPVGTEAASAAEIGADAETESLVSLSISDPDALQRVARQVPVRIDKRWKERVASMKEPRLEDAFRASDWLPRSAMAYCCLPTDVREAGMRHLRERFEYLRTDAEGSIEERQSHLASLVRAALMDKALHYVG